MSDTRGNESSPRVFLSAKGPGLHSGRSGGAHRRQAFEGPDGRPISLDGAGPRAKHQRDPRLAADPGNGSSSFSLRDLIVFILIPILVVVLIRVFVADPYVIPSGSMENTLQVNDRIFTSKLSPGVFALKRGDVVVFKDLDNWLPNETNGQPVTGTQYLVKRLIGLPGDHVQCCNAGGQVAINGVGINETSYLKTGVHPSDIPFDVTVPQGYIFVLGDNRANSADSRYHLPRPGVVVNPNDPHPGFVPITAVTGVAKLVYWPLNHFKVLGRPDSVFAQVPGPDSAR